VVTSPPSHGLLVSHGSRDPRYAVAQQELLAAVQELLPQSQLFTAVLELNDRPLHEQIITIVETQGCDRLTVLPLFLQPGTHVVGDLPQEFAQAQSYLQHHPHLDCQLHPLPYLGAHPALHTSLQSLCPAPHTWILAAHGSTQPQTQAFFSQLHHTLGTQPAYWQHSPSPDETVAALADQGITQIGLLPYFLFPGKITDAICQQFQTLKGQYKYIDFSDRSRLLGQQPEVIRLIAQILCTSTEV
jgi:sirohydrochlorin cobaltochelatase